MINWFNMPDEGLSNGGQFEIKELTATENGTYEKDGEVYNKVTVNVSGGGGSSDFIKANVVITNSQQTIHLHMMPSTEEDTEKIVGFVWGSSGVTIPALSDDFPTGTYPCYIRSGEYIFFYCGTITDENSYTVTGNAEVVPGDTSVSPAIPAIVKVTGDCTITL